MASKASGIVAAAKARLVAITGANYVHDLSADGRVVVGRPSGDEGRMPCAWLSVERVTSDHGDPLGYYTRRMFLTIEAHVPATTDTPEARTLAALDMADDVCTSFEADRSMGALVMDLKLSCDALNGDEVGIPGCGVALVVVEIWWEAASGEGL